MCVRLGEMQRHKIKAASLYISICMWVGLGSDDELYLPLST